MDENQVPEFLREGTPPCCVCDACGRKSWDEKEVGQFCAMPQPDGKACTGAMQMVTHRQLRPPMSK